MRRSGCGTACGSVVRRWKSCPNCVQSWFRFSCRSRRSSTSSSASSASSGSPARWISSRRSPRSSAAPCPSRPVAGSCLPEVSQVVSAGPNAVHSGEPGDQHGLPSRIQSRRVSAARGRDPTAARPSGCAARKKNAHPIRPSSGRFSSRWASRQSPAGEVQIPAESRSCSDPSLYLHNRPERLAIPVAARISRFPGRLLSSCRTIRYGNDEDRTASFRVPC